MRWRMEVNSGQGKLFLVVLFMGLSRRLILWLPDSNAYKRFFIPICR